MKRRSFIKVIAGIFTAPFAGRLVAKDDAIPLKPVTGPVQIYESEFGSCMLEKDVVLTAHALQNKHYRDIVDQIERREKELKRDMEAVILSN